MAIPEPNTVPPVAIRSARTRDIPELTRVLSRAFFDDPVFKWVVPDDLRRRRMLPAYFSLFANAVRQHDEMYLAGNGAGAALWVAPGHPPVAEADAEEFGEIMEQIAGDDAPRLWAVSEAMEAQHPHEPHRYLWFVGVQPAWQGHGIGSALIAPVVERCDCEAVPAYLEATSHDSVRLYERHGFEATGVIDAHGGAPLYPMWREPRRR